MPFFPDLIWFDSCLCRHTACVYYCCLCTILQDCSTGSTCLANDRVDRLELTDPTSHTVGSHIINVIEGELTTWRPMRSQRKSAEKTCGKSGSRKICESRLTNHETKREFFLTQTSTPRVKYVKKQHVKINYVAAFVQEIEQDRVWGNDLTIEQINQSIRPLPMPG